jgi:hypothetical protein
VVRMNKSYVCPFSTYISNLCRLRSLDGIDTHDQAYPLSVSGGVSTSLILPGSANAIGGQAFVIKLRPTKEGSTLSRVLEPPYNLLNGSSVDPSAPLRWRHMKLVTCMRALVINLSLTNLAGMQQEKILLEYTLEQGVDASSSSCA